MELFNSSDESQWEVIKRWIDNSDIYMLILGGRYGSIEPNSGLSYTEMEYDYAMKQKKPVLAVVISENEAFRRGALNKDSVEVTNLKYQEFRRKVTSKICKFFDDTKDIKIAIHETLSDFSSRYKLSGWVSSKDIPDLSSYLSEIETLKEQLRVLKYENSVKGKQLQDKYLDNRPTSNDIESQEFYTNDYDIEERVNKVFDMMNIVLVESNIVSWYEEDDYLTNCEIDMSDLEFSAYFCYDGPEQDSFKKIRFVAIEESCDLKEIMDSLRLLVNRTFCVDTIIEIIIILDRPNERVLNNVNHYINGLTKKFLIEKKNVVFEI